MRDRALFVRLYGEIIDRTRAQTMLYFTCTTITSVDLAHHGVSRDKDICGLWYKDNYFRGPIFYSFSLVRCLWCKGSVRHISFCIKPFERKEK